MKEQLAIVLKELGAEGIQAFYIYLILDYASLWVCFGLVAWGVRTAWKKLNE